MTDRSPDISSRRKRIARFALLALVVGGVILYERTRPVDVELSFAVPPVMRAQAGGDPIARDHIIELEARLYDEDGAESGHAWLHFGPGGLRGPVTLATPITLPRGRYVVRATLGTADGRRVARVGHFDIDGDGPARVELH